MAKKECPMRSNANVTVYCQREDCANWNADVEECDPMHFGVFFLYLEGFFEGLGDLF